ncbi:MAG: hypothetical protein AAF086_05245 [Planctomycetota bacterium]
MNPQPSSDTPPAQSNVWFGVLGVLVVVAFAGLAVFDTSLAPHTAHASSTAAVEPASHAEPAHGTAAAEQPLPLYLSEAGAHAPGATPIPSPKRPPGPQATSLFDNH